MSALIGLDVGTTNTKAVAFDPATGQVIAVTSQTTPAISPAPGWSEIDPAQLWNGVTACLRQIVPRIQGPILGVGIASMAEAGVPLDAAGQPVYRIIHWYDPRTEHQLAQALDRFGAEHLFRITGQAPRNVYSLYKLLWLREHAPTAFASLARWLCVSDFVAWKLTGVAATDYSLASRTMLFDQQTREWSPELLEYAGLRPEQLPKLLPAGTVVGQVNSQAAAETGLPADVPVVIGGHDHLCGAVAAGAIQAGQVVDSVGTAEGVVIPTNSFVYDVTFWQRRICCYAHVVPNLFVVQCGLAMSGGALAWIAGQQFAAAANPVAAALAAAERVPPGARGLLYFPYLGGNGSPVGDENVTGAFIGLRFDHGSAELSRAVLEGVSFGIRHAIEVSSSVVGPVDEPIRVIGGGSRSPLWLQIRANVLGKRHQAEEMPQATGLGAALLAGIGAGIFPSFAAAANAVARQSSTYDPQPEPVDRYARIFREAYLKIYPGLAPVFAALVGLAE
ncbi:MAG TPA: FGGY family carbohydrate kinase [Chloroflexota bacterium]|nr:FGGY family carbohydrate kinase [Chloroflexota bacterium]